MAPHPKILRKNGKPEYAVLPYEEYVELRERLDDAEDLLDLRTEKAEEGGAPGLSLEEAKRELGL